MRKLILFIGLMALKAFNLNHKYDSKLYHPRPHVFLVQQKSCSLYYLKIYIVFKAELNCIIIFDG